MKVVSEMIVQNGEVKTSQEREMVSEQALSEWRRFSDADAVAFCDQHGLSHHVESCLLLAHKTMGITKQPFALLVTDEEVGDTSLVIVATVSGDAEMASSAYEGFLKEWVARTGAERIPISLSYMID
jgi:hypothetical protein